MNIKMRLMFTLVVVMLLTVFATTAVSAHYCTPINKKDGAGSVGTINIVTGEMEIDKKNGGFITVTDGETFSYDVFYHVLLPEGALASGPGGDSQCDGKGVDSALACLGIEP